MIGIDACGIETITPRHSCFQTAALEGSLNVLVKSRRHNIKLLMNVSPTSMPGHKPWAKVALSRGEKVGIMQTIWLLI